MKDIQLCRAVRSQFDPSITQYQGEGTLVQPFLAFLAAAAASGHSYWACRSLATGPLSQPSHILTVLHSWILFFQVQILVLGELHKTHQKPWRQCPVLTPHQLSRSLCCQKVSRFVKHDSLLAFPNHVLHLTCDSP